jgi:hypothetical protein
VVILSCVVFLHGDLIIGSANYNGFVRGPKTKRSCSPCRHCSIKIWETETPFGRWKNQQRLRPLSEKQFIKCNCHNTYSISVIITSIYKFLKILKTTSPNTRSCGIKWSPCYYITNYWDERKSLSFSLLMQSSHGH